MSLKLMKAIEKGSVVVKPSETLAGQVTVRFREGDAYYVSSKVDLLTKRTAAQLKKSNLKELLSKGRLVIVEK